MSNMTRRTAMTLIGATALSAPFVKRAKAQGVLNVYNWADYIAENTIEDFQSETGIAVQYDLYSSVEEMEAKVLTGASGYDVVLQSGVTSPIMVAAGAYETLDKTKMPGWANLDPKIMEILKKWDPQNDYVLPYMWGSVGIAYNIDIIKELLPNADLQSLDILMKAENAEKLSPRGISVLDSPLDAFGLIAPYLSKDIDHLTESDLDDMVEAFAPVRSSVRTFDNTTYLNTLPTGDLAMAMCWSGSFGAMVARAKEAGLDTKLDYLVPETGSPVWVDCWAMLKSSQNKENAYKFLDYMLRPQVIADCTNYTTYANANTKAQALVDESIRNNPALYPDEEAMKRLYAPKSLSTEQNQAMITAWSRLKTG